MSSEFTGIIFRPAEVPEELRRLGFAKEPEMSTRINDAAKCPALVSHDDGRFALYETAGGANSTLILEDLDALLRMTLLCGKKLRQSGFSGEVFAPLL